MGLRRTSGLNRRSDRRLGFGDVLQPNGSPMGPPFGSCGIATVSKSDGMRQGLGASDQAGEDNDASIPGATVKYWLGDEPVSILTGLNSTGERVYELNSRARPPVSHIAPPVLVYITYIICS